MWRSLIFAFLQASTNAFRMSQRYGLLNSLAAGELDIQVPSLARGDEIGSMAKAVAVFRENAVEMRRLQAEADKVRAADEARLKELEAHYVDAPAHRAKLSPLWLRASKN